MKEKPLVIHPGPKQQHNGNHNGFLTLCINQFFFACYAGHGQLWASRCDVAKTTTFGKLRYALRKDTRAARTVPTNGRRWLKHLDMSCHPCSFCFAVRLRLRMPRSPGKRTNQEPNIFSLANLNRSRAPWGSAPNPSLSLRTGAVRASGAWE